jgi:hypothetical protein
MDVVDHRRFEPIQQIRRTPAVVCLRWLRRFNLGRLIVVGLRRFKLNHELQRYRRDWRAGVKQTVPPTSAYARTRPSRLMRHRLVDQDIAALVRAFRRGTPKHMLAERYGISLTSVKRELRGHGNQYGREC